MTAFQARASFGAVIFGAAILAAPLASAQPAAPARIAALQKLADCRKVADAVQRLACYDEAAAVFDQAEAKGDIVVVDRAQAATVKRQAFGFTMPSLDIFDRGAKPEAIDEVTLTIESAQQIQGGKWLFNLEGGQIWRQIDTDELTRTPKPGGKATIKRAALGSYKLSIGGNQAIRVRRDN